MGDFGFAIGLAGFLAGGLVIWLAMRAGGLFADLRRRVEDLEKETQNFASPQKRHTHRTIAGLEDAMALIIDMEIEADCLMARLRTARQILGRTREGPESYENSEWKTDKEEK